MIADRPLVKSERKLAQGQGSVPACVCDDCGHRWTPQTKVAEMVQGLVPLPTHCPSCSSHSWNGGVKWVPPMRVAAPEAPVTPREFVFERKAALAAQTPPAQSYRRMTASEARAWWRSLMMEMLPAFTVTETELSYVKRPECRRVGRLPSSRMSRDGSSPGVVV